ncbi:UNVERIFIED_CONTAM: hypothetical protein Sindi_0273300 [Sesamum indicum]
MDTGICFFHSASHVYPRFPYRTWNNGKLGGRKFASLNFVGWKQRYYSLLLFFAFSILGARILYGVERFVQWPAKPETAMLFTNMKPEKYMLSSTGSSQFIGVLASLLLYDFSLFRTIFVLNQHDDFVLPDLDIQMFLFGRWRKTLICAVNKDAEKSFKKTVEVDRLIDMLRDADDKELHQLVVENVLAFNEGFWIRLAARTETCKSEDDKKDYEELAALLMSVVDRLVHKTNEKIESATDVLKAILKPVVNEEEEIEWPPRDPEALALMQKELNQREQEGHLDEGFLAEVNAQLRQAKEDGDKPGLEAMLQKVLQLYASRVLSKRSYAKKGNEILKAEQFLETLIQAPEAEWNKLLINGLTVGKGDISPEELYAVVKKRIERTLIRTEGGSYQQRILTEYLKGIQARGEEIVFFRYRRQQNSSSEHLSSQGLKVLQLRKTKLCKKSLNAYCTSASKLIEDIK